MSRRSSPAGYLRTIRRTLLASFLALAGVHPAAAGGSPSASAEQDGLTIVAVGDIMMGSGYPSADGLPPGGASLMAPVAGVLSQGDVTFGNLEGPILSDGDAVKKCADPSKCFAFRQPEYVAGQLADAGFDLLSVSNNHMNDFGSRGRSNTMRILADRRIGFAGLDTCPTTVIVRKGLRIGFTSFAPVNGCLNLNDDELVRRVVSGLRRQCDILIVSFHGGAEGASHTHVTRQGESFYGENRGNVYRFARLAVDAGADVVLGHGPHVARAIDLYKGKFIAYSMGNFCTYGQFNLKGPNGIAPILRLQVSKNGDFLGGRIVSVMQQGKGGPVIDPTGQSLEAIRRLTESDIPEAKAKFDASGRFWF